MMLFAFFAEAEAQILNENGNLMGEFLGYVRGDMPEEDSEGFVKPDSLELKQWKRMMDLFVNESFEQSEDSLALHFSNFEMVALTDTSLSNTLYYLIREKSPIQKGWGFYALNPSHNRDMIVAIPHPEFDSFTTQEGVNMFRYLGGRMLAMAGTHRCANDQAANSDGTTTVCSSTNTSEDFKVSDMAHFDSSAFQIAHESIKELSSSVYAINLHGHANGSCEDVFLSNGREDDPKTSLQTVRDSLIAYGVDAAMTGDGSSCPLIGSTNVQGRFINGSTNPADDPPASNSGFFFHVEQSRDVRRSLNGYTPVIQAFGALITDENTSSTLPDLPSLVFNEIHAHPTADANNNGAVQTVSDEFVEIVNTGSNQLDISDWIFADSGQDRHQIEDHTSLVPNQALVIFGGNTPTGDFGGAEVQVASSGLISLSNSGENIYFKTSAQDTILHVDYDGGFTGESINLNPDLTGTSYSAHTSVDTVDNSVFSPGTTIFGNPFLPFVEVTGDAGWRMLAAPTSKYPIQHLNSFTPIQGFGDGFDKNLYTSWDGSSWVAPGSDSDSLENGKGFILYFYDNANAQSSELPVKLRASGLVPDSDVTIDLHTNADKWNLVGNPFDTAIDFSLVTVNGGELVSNVGYVYNPAISNYVTTTSLGDTVAAWQGVFVKDSTASSLTIPTSSKIDGGSLLKSANKDLSYLVIQAKLPDSNIADELVLVFSESSKKDWDFLDLEEIPSLSEKSISISGKGERNGKPVNQSQFSIPLDLKSELRIPLKIESSENTDLVEFKMTKVRSIPQEVTISLQKDDIIYDLKVGSADTYLLNKELLSGLNIVVKSSILTHSESTEKISRLQLFQNYPNPFNPTTRISYQLPVASFVSLNVFDALGRKVSTLIDQHQTAGNKNVNFDGSSLSSGIYFFVLETNSGIRTGKMILLK